MTSSRPGRRARPQRAHSCPAVAPLGASLLLLSLSSCLSGGRGDEIEEAPPEPPIVGAQLSDHLIRPDEPHFKHLWQVTFGGQNAEAYWSYGDDRLSLQITADHLEPETCDKIFVTASDGSLRQVSNGRGVTTCSFFLPGDEEVLYASTHSRDVGCPQKPPRKGGDAYVWYLWPDYDIYVTNLRTATERVLIGNYGYDAEATVSPRGDRIVFTSDRSGDLELYTCDLEGGDLVQVTDTLGYDGGAFFNHRGDRLVFRTTAWTPGREAEEQRQYREDLQRSKVQPSRMEIYTIRPDGSERTQVTALGGAAFAPYFTPDDQHIIFSSNHGTEEGKPMNFDLWICDLDGSNLRRVTTFDDGPGRSFDGFPMFSRDGRFLAFSSNRGDGKVGETNVFIAEWMR